MLLFLLLLASFGERGMQYMKEKILLALKQGSLMNCEFQLSFCHFVPKISQENPKDYSVLLGASYVAWTLSSLIEWWGFHKRLWGQILYYSVHVGAQSTPMPIQPACQPQDLVNPSVL